VSGAGRLALTALLLLPAGARAAEDWQYWSTWAATHRLSPSSSFSVLAETYARDDMSDDYVYDEYVTYSRRSPGGPGWLLQAYFETVESAGGWSGVRSAVAGVSWERELGRGWKMNLADRFFYRLNSPSEWDYHRPKLTLEHRSGRNTLELADEMRADLSGDRADDFYRNRLFVTLHRKVGEKLTLGVGCVRQSDRDGGPWSDFNVLQTVLKCEF
jgi:hypothetical protein